MIGTIVEGFFDILFRVWTIGVFYVLNNRLFSWIKDSRAPKMLYENMTTLPKKENRYEDMNFCLLNSKQHYSWKNMFMNLGHSQNQVYSWNRSTAMYLPYPIESCSVGINKKDISISEFFTSWRKHKLPSAKDSMLNTSYSTGLAPLQSYDYSSVEMELMNNIYKKEKDNYQEMEHLKKEIYALPPEDNYIRAESIDSGFQSFHNVNMVHTCINIDGVSLYISDLCYNKEGKVIAMTVGFGLEDDSSDESFFSGEEDEEDFQCCGIEEDFIVFDSAECKDTQQFCPNSLDEFSVAITVNTTCPEVELKISQTFPPSPSFPCAPKHENKSRSKNKRESKVKLPKVVDLKKSIPNPSQTCGAGTTESPRKKVCFSEDVKIHRIITWDFAYRCARQGPWKDFATDRLHFQRRIDEIASVLEPVLAKKIALMSK